MFGLRHSMTLLIGTAHLALAQRPAGTQGRVSVNAGSATDVTGIQSRAATVAPMVTIPLDARSSLTLRGAGTRFDNRAWSALGGAAFGTRKPVGGAALTLDMSGDATFTSYDRTYLTADVTPALEYAVGGGPVTLFGGAHGTLARVATRTDGRAPFDIVPDRASSVSRHGVAAIAGAAARFMADDDLSVGVSVREERGTVADTAQRDRSAGLSLSGSRLSVGASVGERVVAGMRASHGSAWTSIPFGDAMALDVAAGRYPANRLTGIPAGTFASAGISMKLGTRPRSLPRPAGISAAGSGFTRLTIAAPDAQRVEVAGDFNTWSFVPARRSQNGVWYVDLRIPAGEYRYAFRVDGGAWRIPDGARAAEDDFGGKSAWLVVPSNTPGRQ
jgi:hypothetical protein